LFLPKRGGSDFVGPLNPVPPIPKDLAQWIEFLRYFDALLLTIPLGEEPEILSFPGEPWKELAEWRAVASEADGRAVAAIEHLLDAGAWPKSKRQDTFWFRVEHRIKSAHDVCTILATRIRFSGEETVVAAIPQATIPAKLTVEWLLLSLWNRAPWLRDRFEPNPWSQYP